MPTSPIDDLADLERSLGGVFFGRFTGGAFGGVRQPPRSMLFAEWIRRRDAAAILNSGWWGSIWDRAADRATPILTRVSREAGSRALREIASRITEARAQDLAVSIAERRVADIVAVIRRDTSEGLQVVLSQLQVRGLSTSELVSELGARLGPTAKQAQNISRWEAVQRAAGASRKEILAGAKLRARNAANLRARAIASDQLTRQVSEARIAVMSEAGVLIYSENQRDERVRELHIVQTGTTISDPRPAGEPWTPEAPFRGLPPYEIFCRCYPAPAATAS